MEETKQWTIGTPKWTRNILINKSCIKCFAFLDNFILIKKLIQCKVILVQNGLDLKPHARENKLALRWACNFCYSWNYSASIRVENGLYIKSQNHTKFMHVISIVNCMSKIGDSFHKSFPRQKLPSYKFLDTQNHSF